MRFFTFLFALFLFSKNAFAAPVDVETARLVGLNFLKTRAAFSPNSAALEPLESPTAALADGSEAAVWHLFGAGAGGGFVLVAADDRVQPILAYSTEGTAFSTQNLPPNLAKWLENYRQQMLALLEKNSEPTFEISARWAALLDGSAAGAPESGVPPLVKTAWDQAPGYNDFCPFDWSTFSNSVTGCVATAMAQIMYFWKTPAQGTDFHSYFHSNFGTISANFGASQYDWASMPLFSSNSAVAQLMFDCGVSVEMDYSGQSSGAYCLTVASPKTHCSEHAFKTYFGYKSTAKGEMRANFSDAQWDQKLRAELDAGRPLLYQGSGSGGGHAFVCDGYDDWGLFHFNWGWSGQFDGYFYSDELDPSGVGTGGGSGGYNSNQGAIFGLEPASGGGGGGSAAAAIEMYDELTVSPDPIQYNEGFSAHCDIVNNGQTAFFGDICAAVFDDNSTFIDYVEILTESNGLPPGYHYTNGLTFENWGLDAPPGDYTVCVFVKPTGASEWTGVAASSFFWPCADVEIEEENANGLELNAPIKISGNCIEKGKPFTVQYDVKNTTGWNYSGLFSIDIHEQNGDWIQELAETQKSLCAGCHFSNGLTFNAPALDLPPGSYLLAAWEQETGGEWRLVGSTFYENPLEAAVCLPPLGPDPFEPDNTVGSAASLPLAFSSGVAWAKTTGSNLHNGSDLDFYKVALPSGFSYQIAPRLHDSGASGNGQTYSCDGVFSFRIGQGGTWSNAFDDVYPSGSFWISGGQTLFFQVAPFFAGQTGDYLFEAKITRTTNVSTDEAEAEKAAIRVFPNPATDRATVVLPDGWAEKDLASLRLASPTGQTARLFEPIFSSEKNLEIDLVGLSSGPYFLILESKNGAIRRQKIAVADR